MSEEGTFHFVSLEEQPHESNIKSFQFHNTQHIIEIDDTFSSSASNHPSLSFTDLETPIDDSESTPVPKLVSTESVDSDPTTTPISLRMKIRVPVRSPSITTEPDEYHPRSTRRVSDPNRDDYHEFGGTGHQQQHQHQNENKHVSSNCSTAAVTPQMDLLQLNRAPSAVSTMSIPCYAESRQLSNPSRLSVSLWDIAAAATPDEQSKTNVEVLCDRISSRFDKIDGILNQLDSKIDHCMKKFCL